MLDRFAVSLPDGLHNTNIGNTLADSLPLTSMLCCLPTLMLFWRSRRLLDLAVLTTGFLLACVYHVCHMAQEGLVASRVLGIPGPVWRSLDVLYAQWLLGRTFGHALAATHPTVKGVTNAVFPALLLYHGATGTQLSVAVCGRALLCTLAAAVAAKLVVEGYEALPQYPKGRGCITVGLFLAGFVAFPLPELLPRHYWLFHSLWHAFLGAGYYELYAMLEEESGEQLPHSENIKVDTSEQLNGYIAATEEKEVAHLHKDTSTKSAKAASAAQILAYSGGFRESLSRRASWREHSSGVSEAAAMEGFQLGRASWLHAERLKLWVVSVQRLARLLCMHS